jgi:uncharacterized protein (DUF302 family)
MEITRSQHNHGATVERLIAAIEQRGIKVFAQIDHAAAARAAGLELDDEEVVLFGNPKAGTRLMQEDRRVGIELPLRILVWHDGDEVLLGYNDPRELTESYMLEQHVAVLEAMSTLLGELVTAAAG